MVEIGRYNPYTKKEIGDVYRPWYILVALLSILTGAALIGMGIAMKVLDGDLSWILCHIWTGIPLFLGGFFTLVPCASKKKNLAVIYMIFMFIVMIVCATGAIISGFKYWMQYWQATKLVLDKDKCVIVNNICNCPGVFDMPSKVDSCSTLMKLTRLMIATIAIDTVGFAVSLAAVFLSFMSVCCGPWVYLETYTPSTDPDFGAPIVNLGKTNKAYAH